MSNTFEKMLNCLKVVKRPRLGVITRKQLFKFGQLKIHFLGIGDNFNLLNNQAQFLFFAKNSLCYALSTRISLCWAVYD
jgi:hypothetical protein